MPGNSTDTKPPGDSGGDAPAQFLEFSGDTPGSLLDVISKRTGIQFRDFRRDMLGKVIRERMAALGTPGYADYERHVLGDGAELAGLSRRLLVSASFFFRDPFTFEYLGKFVVPLLINKEPATPIRIWSAGCARGEEAYSVAIQFAEARKTRAAPPEVFVLGTDVDHQALAKARQGIFPRESLREVKLGLLDDYFVSNKDGYAIREHFGAHVQFSIHDILSGAVPRVGLFADYHLILCRNVLMYFEEKVRDKAIALFERSLAPRGWLVLGNSEGLPERFQHVFEEAAWGANVFRKRD